MSIAGTGVAPVNSVSSGGSIGYVLVQSSASGTLTVQNTGNGNLAGADSPSLQTNLHGSVSATTGTGFSGSGGTVNLTDSGSSSFSYVFAPTSRGTSSTTVTANFSNGSDNLQNQGQSVSTAITATGVAPVNSVSGSDAGYVRVNRYGTSSSTAQVTVQNVGDGNLAGSGAAYNLALSSVGSPAPSGPFVASGGNPGSASLADNASTTLGYTYQPLSRGTDSAAVSLNFTNGKDDGSNLSQTVSATLSGQGVGPVFESRVGANAGAAAVATPNTPLANGGSTSTINFGTLTYLSNRTLLLDITNITTDPGGAALTDLTLLLSSISGGTDPTDFSISMTPGTVVSEGNSVFLPIMLTANMTGLLTASLTLTTDEGAALGNIGDYFTYQLTALSVSSVPEPASFMVLGAGLAGLGVVRRRRARSRLTRVTK